MWGFSAMFTVNESNYSSLAAVIKYGGRPRDAESTEVPGLLRLQSGGNGKGGSEASPEPQQLMGVARPFALC